MKDDFAVEMKARLREQEINNRLVAWMIQDTTITLKKY